MKIKDIEIEWIVVGRLGTNCYVVHKEDSDKCILVDPGAQADRILDFLSEKQLKPEAILLTHGHFDHILALSEVAATKRCQVMIGEKEEALLSDANQNCSIWGTGSPVAGTADRLLKDGEVIEIADMKIKAIHTPGHTGGSCCYYFEEGFALCGDTIFFESAGRTDFPTGNEYQLVHSIQEKLFTLPEETVLFSGHGPQTSVGYEKKNNPYC